jgi:uncharacterized membrane protein YhhN
MIVFMISVLSEQSTLYYAVKPMFMAILMLFHHQQIHSKYSFFSIMIQAGLFFSWSGDIVLMLPDTTESLFIVGLGSFLIAHLGYSLGFYRTIKKSSYPFSYTKAASYSLPFILVTGPFFYYIKDSLPSDLFFPVLGYSCVISAMGMFSAWRNGHVNQKTFSWVLAGAILFILSDCVLALNLFSIKPQQSSDMAKYLAILNMALYLTGQFMITVGAIYQIEPTNSK